MSTQLAIWNPPKRRRWSAPKGRRRGNSRRWIPRCEDCQRRVWAASSLKRRFGKLLGGGCYRKRAQAARAARRLTIPMTIVVRDPGHIPGQAEIEMSGADP